MTKVIKPCPGVRGFHCGSTEVFWTDRSGKTYGVLCCVWCDRTRPSFVAERRR